ncbi:MAG: response regulator [Nocardioidaceae bacterium]
MASTRILLADDHALVRRGVRLILDSEPDLEVVAEAATGAEAVDIACHETVDLAILDVAMPDLTGLQAARELRRRAPDVKILLLSIYDNDQYFLEALRVGVAGYVLKSVADRELVQACRAAMAGEPFVHPGTMTRLVEEYLYRARTGGRVPSRVLTPREEQIVKLIAEGNSSKAIADALVISVKTVERHRENVLAKLDLRDRLELTRYAIRHGLVEP